MAEKKRGFAAMDPEQQRQIASKGGRAVHSEPESESAGGEEPKRGNSRRGFAAMDEAKRRDIASRGGRAAHERGRAHEWSKEEARAAGRLGGRAAAARRSSGANGTAGAGQRGIVAVDEAERRDAALQGEIATQGVVAREDEDLDEDEDAEGEEIDRADARPATIRMNDLHANNGNGSARRGLATQEDRDLDEADGGDREGRRRTREGTEANFDR